MAKVVAPLQSFSASGKLANSLVFFSHLGRNVVRKYAIPANPKTTAQGDVRLLLGALGRGARAVNSKGDVVNALKTVIPQDQTWVSTYTKFCTELFADPSALTTAFGLHDADTDFTAKAEELGLVALQISYAGTQKTISGGAQLFALASYLDSVNAQNPDIFGSGSPWNKTLDNWIQTDVNAFASAIQAAS